MESKSPVREDVMGTGSYRRAAWLLVLAGNLFLLPAAWGQQPEPPAASPSEEDLPLISDSRSGYVDTALPLRQLRLRYDTAYNNRQATRGEFFYAATAPVGPGLPRPESSVDFQEVTVYGEYVFGKRFSTFLEVPIRFANFDVNTDHSGLS